MPRTIRFHLDENCHRAIGEALKRRGTDLTATPEVGLLSASDDEQAAFCLAQGRVLFTQDHDFLKFHATGQDHPGIVYCAKDSRTIGEIIHSLVMIWEILEPEEMRNHVEFI
jgi:predicted nuclease of predicted toxin-antitoxin system